MRTERNGAAPADASEPKAVERCSCGRIATARCWLGEHSPGRWLFACRLQGALPPETPEAA